MLEEADYRIRPIVIQSPVTYEADPGIYLKWENHQVTGSFKIRGALNKILAMDADDRKRGLVTCSAGNHGQGVALAAKQTNTPVIVFASEHAVPSKVEAMRGHGAEVRLVAGGYALAENTAREFALQSDMTFISPYNDELVIAGQGTVGLELQKQVDQCGSVWVPIGGGGLIAGIASAYQSLADRPRIIGVQSEASPYFHSLFHRNTQQDVVETDSIADGLAGAVEQGSVTIALVQQLVDDVVLVSEAEIIAAIRFCWLTYHEVIEGSAAAALAAVMRSPGSSEKRVVVISGGNIQPEVHQNICHPDR